MTGQARWSERGHLLEDIWDSLTRDCGGDLEVELGFAVSSAGVALGVGLEHGEAPLVPGVYCRPVSPKKPS